MLLLLQSFLEDLSCLMFEKGSQSVYRQPPWAVPVTHSPTLVRLLFLSIWFYENNVVYLI